MANLFTHHDPNHFHAFCGILTILHFLYRAQFLFGDVPDAGFGRNILEDVISFIIIVLPNVTSFLLKVVPVKKGKDGFTIWKEYRWHAFIFAARCWYMMAIFIYQRHFVPEGLVYHRIYRVIGVYLAMYAAQKATEAYPPQASTIRGMYKGKFSVFAATFMQFLGTAQTLVGNDVDDIALPYFGLFIIQLNAFNMTLRKKRKIGPVTSQAFYSIMLSTGFYKFLLSGLIKEPPTSVFDPRFRFVYLALASYYCRRGLAMNRFAAWATGLATIELVSNTFNIL